MRLVVGENQKIGKDGGFSIDFLEQVCYNGGLGPCIFLEGEIFIEN